MKKTIMYAVAAVALAAVALIVVIGCNNGDGGINEGLNDLLGGFVNRNPGGEEKRYAVNVENGRTAAGSDYNYVVNEEVFIIAEKELDGRLFNGWTVSIGDGVNIADPGNVITSFFMPPNAVTVRANFVPKTKFTIGYNGNENTGGAVPTDPNAYDSGATVTVLGPGNMSKNGHYFSGWSTEKNGGHQLGDGETFFLTESMTLYARWTPNYVTKYNVSVTDGTGGGSYAENETVTVTANPRSGMTFTSWTSDPSVGFKETTASQTTFIMIAKDVRVTANFKTIEKYTVTVNSAGNGATGGGSYEAGATVSISAGAPPSGQAFKNWAVTAGEANINNPDNWITSFTMPANNVTVTANFQSQNVTPPAATYTLTVNRNLTEGGTATADKTTNINAGSYVSISATANYGYKFEYWTISGGEGEFVNANLASTRVKVNSNLTITANFSQNSAIDTSRTYTLTVNRNPTVGGTTTPASNQANITGGTEIGISATPATGYKFDKWTISGSGSIADAGSASTKVTVNGNVTVTANFQAPQAVIKDVMLDDFENYIVEDGGYVLNKFGYAWYFYTHLTSVAKDAYPSGCNEKTYTPYIEKDSVEIITNAERNGTELRFIGGYGPPYNGNYSGVMRFENVRKPWASPASSPAGSLDVYPGVGMGTMLTNDTVNGVGESFKNVTAIKFWMKVSENVKTVGFKVETVDQLPTSPHNPVWTTDGINSKKECPADNSHQVYLKNLSTDWNQYTVKISELKRNEYWEKNKPYTFNITRALKIAWFVNEENGPVDKDGMVAVDDIEIINYTVKE